MKIFRTLTLGILTLALTLGASPCFAATAASGSGVQAATAAPASPPPAAMPDDFTTKAKQAILVDMTTGATLFNKNADDRMAPSSMTKVMTAYLVFEALRSGKLTMDTVLPVSVHAWSTQGSKMFVPAGGEVKVGDLIQGVIVDSGNDACIVLAEGIAGSESAFADMMNQKAAELGMHTTHFVNADGLPDPDHYSSARDLATLTAALIRDFPEYYHYFSQIDFTYNKTRRGVPIRQENRNPLLYRNIGVDGVKTGHTDAGGYGLIGSIQRDGHRLIAVVNGLNSEQERADESAGLLEWGERTFAIYTIAKPDVPVGNIGVSLGRQKTVGLAVTEPIAITLPRRVRPDLKISLLVPDKLVAPVKKGQQVGILHIAAPGFAPVEYPVVTTADSARLGFWGRIEARIHGIFKHDQT